MRILRFILLLAGPVITAPGPALAVDLVPHSLFPPPTFLLTLVDVAMGVPVAGENTGCPIDVIPCVQDSDLTLVLEASNGGAATVDAITFASFLRPAPPNLTGLGRVPAASEPDGLADVQALWGGFLSGDPRVLFPNGLAPGQTSNRFFLSFAAGTGPGTLLPVFPTGTGVAGGFFEIVPEPPLAVFGALALLALRSRHRPVRPSRGGRRPT